MVAPVGREGSDAGQWGRFWRRRAEMDSLRAAEMSASLVRTCAAPGMWASCPSHSRISVASATVSAALSFDGHAAFGPTLRGRLSDAQVGADRFPAFEGFVAFGAFLLPCLWHGR